MRLLIALGMALVWSGSQAQMKIPAIKLAKPPTIDGVLSEGEWEGASHLTGFIDPNTEKPVSEQTEVWLAYDSEAVYVAFKLHDSQPNKIVATSTQPGTLGTEDLAEFFIDTFNKRGWDSMNYFMCNSKGVQGEQLAGGRSAKKEWRGAWDSKASITTDGWAAEMRIPWKIMDLPAKGKRNVMVAFARNQLRSSLFSFLPNLSNQMWFDRGADWQGVEIPACRANPASYQAYLSPSLMNEKINVAAGLDVRYRLSPQLTGLLSLNPDFENVEQDIAGIEFTRSERYLDDNRPFFNEGSSFTEIYDSYGSGFYSRRINDFDIGAKAYGSFGSRHEIGVLATQTGDEETDAVFRYAYKFSPRSSITLYGTSLENDSADSRLFGTRLLYGKGPWSGLMTGAVSDDDGLTKTAGSGRVSYVSTKWIAITDLSWIEPGFNPALGYCAFNDLRGINTSVDYTEMYSKGYLRMFEVYLPVQSYEHYDGSNLRKTFAPSISVSTKNNAFVRLSALLDDFETESEQTGACTVSFYNTAYTSQFTLSGSLGTRGGYDTAYYSARLRHRFGKNLDTSLAFYRQDYLGISEQTVFTVGWTIDPKRTLTARTVYSQGKTNAYLAYKSAGFTGMDWYLIVGDPNALEWKDRIVAKLVWAW